MPQYWNHGSVEMFDLYTGFRMVHSCCWCIHAEFFADYSEEFEGVLGPVYANTVDVVSDFATKCSTYMFAILVAVVFAIEIASAFFKHPSITTTMYLFLPLLFGEVLSISIATKSRESSGGNRRSFLHFLIARWFEAHDKHLSTINQALMAVQEQ